MGKQSNVENIEFIVKAAYEVILGREPDPQGYETFSSALKNGLKREEFYKILFQSVEFRTNRKNDSYVKQWFENGFNSTYSNWEAISEMNADVIIPLKVVDKELSIRLPVKDCTLLNGLLANNKVYEPHITNAFTQLLKPGDTFVDAGANFGYFTVLGASLVGPSGRVISFEPVRFTNQYCKLNIDLNSLGNVNLLKYGLWDSVDDKKIETQENNAGVAHLYNNEKKEYDNDHNEVIKCVPFDLLLNNSELSINRLNLIKMDIEGSEPFALSGMKQALTKFKPIIILEVNRFCLNKFFNLDTKCIWDILQSLGYNICVFEEQVSNTKLKDFKYPGLKLKYIDKIDVLNNLCPMDGLIDILAFPK